MKRSECKILILPYTHTLSHLSRPLEISKQISSKRWKFYFGGNSNKIKFIKEEGFEVHSVYEPDPELLFNNIRNKKIKFIANDILNRMIESDLKIFQKIKPDLVITDGRFSAMMSTQIAGIKHIAIVNASSTAYRAIPYFPILKRGDVDQYPPVSLLTKLINPLNLKFEMFCFDNIMGVFKSLTKKYKLSHEVTATNCLCGVDLTLLADLPEFFPTKNLPSTYHYIGPVTWKAPKSQVLPEWWPIDKENNKLAYITMGTTGEPELFQTIYDTFKTLNNVISIITTGSQTDGIRTIPGKIYVTDFMDGGTVMEMADIVLCHGGNGTIYQALDFGKPILGIPTIPDQEFNMRMVERLNVGRKLDKKAIISNPTRLIQLIRELTSDNTVIANSLCVIKDKIQKTDGALTGAKIITEFIAHQL